MVLLILSLLSLTTSTTFAKPAIYRAEPKKTQVYIRDGVVEGGEVSANGSYVSNIRRSKNPGFERIVLDIDGLAIPSFHAALEPESKRIVFTLDGKTKTSFDPEAVKKAFAKSSIVRGIELFPKLDEESWSFNLKMKSSYPIEIFTLSAPNRIVIDIKDVVLPTAVESSSRKAVKKIQDEITEIAEPAASGSDTTE